MRCWISCRTSRWILWMSCRSWPRTTIRNSHAGFRNHVGRELPKYDRAHAVFRCVRRCLWWPAVHGEARFEDARKSMVEQRGVAGIAALPPWVPRRCVPPAQQPRPHTPVPTVSYQPMSRLRVDFLDVGEPLSCSLMSGGDTTSLPPSSSMSASLT